MVRSAPTVDVRVGWVDAAKGMSIALVVLFHATLVDATPPESGPWWAVNAVFATLRMPLFFLASGLFAASSLRKRWPDLLRGRVLLLVYVYVLWLTIRRLYFGALSGDLDLTWQDYVLPDSDMWFLYVLAVFFVVARVVRSVPPGAQIGVAAAVSVWVGAIDFDREMYKFDDMAIYFVFFVAGCYWSSAIRGKVAGVTAPVAVGAVGVFLLLTALVTVADLREVPPFRFVMSVAAIAAGLSAAVVLVPTRPGALLAHLGRHSLPIYVMHTIVIRTLTRLAEVVGWDLRASLISPVVLTVIAVTGSLAAYTVLKRVPGLFEAPGWLQRALGGGRAVDSDVAPPVQAADVAGSPASARTRQGLAHEGLAHEGLAHEGSDSRAD